MIVIGALAHPDPRQGRMYSAIGLAASSSGRTFTILTSDGRRIPTTISRPAIANFQRYVTALRAHIRSRS